VHGNPPGALLHTAVAGKSIHPGYSDFRNHISSPHPGYALSLIGQRQIYNGGSTDQGVIRRMNSARARAQGINAGQPPDGQRSIAQSMG